MPKPYHIIATEDEHGYNITIPENPDVSAHCTEPADIMPAAAREQDEQSRHERSLVKHIHMTYGDSDKFFSISAFGNKDPLQIRLTYPIFACTIAQIRTIAWIWRERRRDRGG